ncbi:uncharacterized protein LOC134208142 [Armigeres subalbatus]|uniref:uncharacterized protein LOC134208142 n=1 Tax=Armigeres subalbatus TaxID=124917 RepID=UPI002ED54230
MKPIISLGVCVLSSLVALFAVEAFPFETPRDKHSAAPKNYQDTVKPVGTKSAEQVPEYVPSDLAGANEHQHEKRETLTHPNAVESLQLDMQPQHIRIPPRLPFYVEEPNYVVVRRPSTAGIAFIPQRGRKSDPTSNTATALKKRELSIRQMLDGRDYFVPNRGKKRVGNGISKKIKFDDILNSDELFIPNRGKKELLDLFPAVGSGKIVNEFQPVFSKKNVMNAIQNIGSADVDSGEELFYPTRGKKNILENLAQNQDTFFSSRGRRNPVAWSLLNDNGLGPWEYVVAADDCSSSEADRQSIDRSLSI